MKFLRSLNQWGSLYILIVLGMAALFWEENLKIDSTQHKILASGLILLVGFLVFRWINHHHENFIDNSPEEKDHQYSLIYHQTKKEDLELKK